MDIKEELIASFEFMNLTLESKVLKKCEDLCELYNIEPEEFVNIWFAYAASIMCTDSPTLDKLDLMEKKKLQKHNKDKLGNKTPVRTPKRGKIEVNDHTSSKQEIEVKANNDAHEERTKTNETDVIIEPEILDESITAHLSSTQDTTKYADRANPLSVRISFGKDLKSSRTQRSEFSVELFDEENSLNADAKYMYEVMGQKISCLNSLTNLLGHAILKKNNLMLSDASTKNHIGAITTYGRIVVDGKGHLNVQSIILEGTSQMNSGHCVQLNIDKISRIALFPGQVVVVKGKMLSGNKLVAESILTDGSPNLPLEPPVLKDPLRIVVAAGPYTLSDNLSYDPMRDLLNYVADNEPHVLMLMGPFVDENHPTIATGDIGETFDIFFDTLMGSISAALQDTNIQIVVISSMKDAHHHNVYPTPPYRTSETFKNIKFFSDPCMLKLDGLVLGSTTVDVMYHIAKEELVTTKDSETMSRLASHIIQQNNFYPLYPPSTEVNVSHQFLETNGIMDCLPHILVLPSTFRGFIRGINGCLVINPERLIRNNGGGAFADITVSPGTSQTITERVSCKIMNI